LILYIVPPGHKYPCPQGRRRVSLDITPAVFAVKYTVALLAVRASRGSPMPSPPRWPRCSRALRPVTVGDSGTR